MLDDFKRALVLCGFAALCFFSGAERSQAQVASPSMPPGTTPGWAAPAFVPPQASSGKPQGPVTQAVGAPITYFNTPLTKCPAGQLLDYFYYSTTAPAGQSSSWCGAAEAEVAIATATDPVRSRVPYRVTSCVAGQYWTYSHMFRDSNGTVTGMHESGRFSGINMVCRPGQLVVGLLAASSVTTGGTVPLTVTVHENGVLAAGKGVSVSVVAATATGSVSGCSGVTDAGGQLQCVYTAPPKDTVNQLIASCVGCDNTATASISVNGPPSCRAVAQAGLSTEDPIFPATGEKITREMDYRGFGPHALTFERTYRSSWATGGAKVGPGEVIFGKAWTHNHNALFLLGVDEIKVMLADGTVTVFRRSGATWTAVDSVDTLTFVGGTTWSYFHRGDDSTWRFSEIGKLLSRTDRNGWQTSYTYGIGRLTQITNHFGQVMTLTYNAAEKITSLTAPGSQITTFAYDLQGRLASVTYPGAQVRTYHYEDTTFPLAVTGITDENGQRYATYAYDAQGRAVTSQLGGGLKTYSVSYSASGATTTDPLGTQRSYTYSTANGVLAVTSASGPSPRGQGDAASRAVGAGGLIDSETDYLGTQKMFTWDINRRLPLTVTEAANRTEARTISTQWHATLALPVLVTEAGRITAFTYDAVGNMLSQTVTDTATGGTRTWAWTYNSTSKLLGTETAPNGGITTYAYNGAGRLTTLTNPSGHVTTYTYDTPGRLATTTDPTGLVTTFGYDSRNRLLSSAAAGLTKTFTYFAAGQVQTVSMPSGHVMTYTYDNAHRLTGWSDNRGSSALYTLDAMGNRTGEQLKDGSTVVWQLAQTINTLNRVTNATVGTGGTVQSEAFGYDANGDLTSQTNGLSQSTSYGLDGLKRIKAITNAANATANLSYNALDSVTGASDFKGAATTYTRNAFGEATQEASADAGTRVTAYDRLGLPSQVTDALSQATTILRDNLGRPTQLTFQDAKVTHLRYDLAGSDYNAPGAANASKGYLSEIEDRSGITKWQRDALGRVTKKVQALINGATHTTQYSYNAQGLLDTLTYPGGGALQHLYTAQGRLSSMKWNGTDLVTGLTWNAAGQPTGWTWAFASPIPATRTYDTAGRVTGTEVSNYSYDAAGRITSLSQSLGQPADSNPLNTSVSFASATFTVGYDAVGRITSFGDNLGNSTAFTYDANGNRLTSTEIRGSATIARTYSVDPTGNKLLGFTQVISDVGGSSSAAVTYAYNANGELTGNGLAQYGFNPENRLSSVTIGNTETSPTTRYAHNALGQRTFKTEPLFEDIPEQPGDAGFLASLANFFARFWSPTVTPAEQLGFAYVYNEDGTLLGEYGSGGPQSTGSSQYIWLPTPSGPMPIAAIVNGSKFAVHADHLNTPRKLTNANGEAAWQWKYSAFGDEQPTVAANRFIDPTSMPGMGSGTVANVNYNIRYPGQYVDSESGLHYNYFRSYSPNTGRYTQADPIGLDGGWNRMAYVGGNPLIATDPEGLQAAGAAVLGGGAVTGTGAGAAAAGAAVSGAAVAGAGLLGYGAGSLLYPLIESPLSSAIDWCTSSMSGSGSGRHSCTASCNVTVIDPKLDGKVPGRVTGSARGKTEPEACAEAKRVATQSAPRGTYARHCQCSCSKS